MRVASKAFMTWGLRDGGKRVKGWGHCTELGCQVMGALLRLRQMGHTTATRNAAEWEKK